MHFTHRIEEDTLFITLTCSSLDAKLVSPLRNEIQTLVRKSPEKSVVLDLASIHFMDSSGFGSLIAILKEIKDRKKRLYLTNLSSQVESTFNILNLDKLFTIIPSPRTVS